MVNSPSPSDEQPYRALDHFYTHALSNIPPDVLPIVKKVFAIIRYFRFYPEYLLATMLACLLYLENDSFLLHLKRLGMIRTDDGHDNSTSICFRRFLKDPNRSGQFYTPKSESYLHAFRALSHILSNYPFLPIILRSFQVDQNTYSKDYGLSLRIWASGKLCDIRRGAGVEWTSLLRHFDFRCLAYTCHNIPYHGFKRFLRRLYTVSALIGK
jgi:hypothetical protein